ncbi:MAG TPA: hypothetical protein VMT75_02210 [Candidatus Saccharimonadales bacterium]|nr:hypothetical protein [Candidatus Saccharimonadales bacterium]
MRKYLLVAFGMLSLGATLLHGQGPSYIYDKQADFSRYKLTFGTGLILS